MYSIEDLIYLLETDRFDRLAREKYTENKDKIEIQFQDEEMFISYLKGLYIDMFTKINNGDKEKILLQLNFGGICVEYVDLLIELMNRAADNPFFSEPEIEELKDLKKYENDALFEALSKRDEEIKKFALVTTFTPIEKIEEAVRENNPVGEGIKITDEILSMIKRTVNIETSKKTYFTYFSKEVSELYSEIGNDILTKIALDLNLKAPEINILFEDGTIVNYKKSGIKVRPYNFDTVIYYAKLELISMYRNPNTSLSGLIVGQINTPEDLEKMPEKEFIQKLGWPFGDALKKLNKYEEEYNKKLLEDPSSRIKGIKKLVNKYNL